MKNLVNLVLLSVLLLSAASCGNEGCQEMASVNARCSFVSRESLKPYTMDSLTVRGAGVPGDSLLYDRARSQQFVKLPLRITENQTTYLFDFLGGEGEVVLLRDTVTFTYQNFDYYISQDCGCLVKHKVSEVSYTRNFLDSVIIVQPMINNIDEENFIFLF